MSEPTRICIISTGGTIEKTYNEMDGVLRNDLSNLDVALAHLVLEAVKLVRVPLMNKDSTEMSDTDHTLIAKTAGAMAEAHDGVVIVHGTDRLHITGERMVELLGEPAAPIVLTGAMRPYQLRSTDAIQNLTEALLAAQLLPGGIWVVMHSNALRFPGVIKDTARGEFIRDPNVAPPAMS